MTSGSIKRRNRDLLNPYYTNNEVYYDFDSSVKNEDDNERVLQPVVLKAILMKEFHPETHLINFQY